MHSRRYFCVSFSVACFLICLFETRRSPPPFPRFGSNNPLTEKSQAVGRPSGLSSHIGAVRYLRPSIARQEAPPVLIAHLADGAGDNEVINIAKVDQLLDSKTNGPVPLHVKKKDNNLLITFNDGADLDQGSDLPLKSRF